MPIEADRPGTAPGDGTQHQAPEPIALLARPMAVRQALADLIAQLHPICLSDEELGSVELVVAEALNNIVEHAYGGDPAGRISITWTMGDAGLRLRIADNGAPMPDGRIPLNNGGTASDHAALVPEGGFGWFLITGLAHDIAYRRQDTQNLLTFRMAVGQVAGQA